MRKDPSSILPDGQRYEFWEKEPVWERELFVSNTDPRASDENDGSEGRPFRTIGRAAAEAAPGTRVRIHAGIYREFNIVWSFLVNGKTVCTILNFLSNFR